MKGVAGTDAYGRLERAYAFEDPWNLNSDLEISRFEWTNKVIQDQFGALDSMLESGAVRDTRQATCKVFAGICTAWMSARGP